MANWSVLKNPDCSNALRSKLHRNFGKLYASQGRFDKALKQLANDVFYSSVEIGPEHIDTAGGYYHMATIFFSRVRHTLPGARLIAYQLTPQCWCSERTEPRTGVLRQGCGHLVQVLGACTLVATPVMPRPHRGLNRA